MVPPMPTQRPRILHAMIRVRDLDRSLRFYVDILGMTVRLKADYPEGRYTLVFLSFDITGRAGEIELTHNWDVDDYDLGSGYGHIAIGVADIAERVADLAARGVRVIRPAGPRADQPDEVIAFIEDPDGYKIELICEGSATP